MNHRNNNNNNNNARVEPFEVSEERSERDVDALVSPHVAGELVVEEDDNERLFEERLTRWREWLCPGAKRWVERNLSSDPRPMKPSPRDAYVFGLNNKRVEIWDGFILLVLLVMAWSVPYEIGVSGGHLWRYYGLEGVLWGEAINLLFVADTVLYFFRATRDKHGRLVWRLHDIVLRYLKGWFILDILSCFPVDLIAYFYQVTPKSWGFHVLELLQTLKLLRLARISRRFKSSPALLRASLRMSQGPIQVFRVFVLSFYVVHVMACAWCFVANLEDQPSTWVYKYVSTEKTELDPIGADLPENHLDMYILALYWAAVTMVSLGYGDVVPLTRAEYWFCSFTIMISAFLWAWVVASMVDIVSTLQAEENLLRNQLAVLNRVAHEHRPLVGREEWNELMDEARMFLQLSFWRNQAHISFNELSEATGKTLSPHLNRRLALLHSNETLRKLDYLTPSPAAPIKRSTLAFLADRMAQRRIASGETIHPLVENDVLFIQFGICARGYRKWVKKSVTTTTRDQRQQEEAEENREEREDFLILGRGAIFNQDNPLIFACAGKNGRISGAVHSRPAWKRETLLALTFCDAISLSSEEIEHACEMDPGLARAVKWRIMKNALIRRVKRYGGRLPGAPHEVFIPPRDSAEFNIGDLG